MGISVTPDMLADHLLLQILEYAHLASTQLCDIRLASKQFNRVATDDHLWRFFSPKSISGTQGLHEAFVRRARLRPPSGNCDLAQIHNNKLPAKMSYRLPTSGPRDDDIDAAKIYHHGDISKECSLALREDKAIMSRAAWVFAAKTLPALPSYIFDDDAMCRHLLQSIYPTPELLRHFPKRVRACKALMLPALEHNSNFVVHSEPSLLFDLEFFSKALDAYAHRPRFWPENPISLPHNIFVQPGARAVALTLSEKYPQLDLSVTCIKEFYASLRPANRDEAVKVMASNAKLYLFVRHQFVAASKDLWPAPSPALSLCNLATDPAMDLAVLQTFFARPTSFPALRRSILGDLYRLSTDAQKQLLPNPFIL